ncbi:MAG: hypothetical protein HY567_02040 [Candidatus Kerfeldbacteria bacterium]|nr:hypothetical protein [Candidatus Kerfeldbacteria bacterium]
MKRNRAVSLILAAVAWSALITTVSAQIRPAELDAGDGAGTTAPQLVDFGSCTYQTDDGRESCVNNVTATDCAKRKGGQFAALTSCRLTFTPNVPIPGLFEGTQRVDETLLGRYISGFYVFFAGVAGILAVVMMMWGGFHYITAAGNPQRMNEGKSIISGAIIGLILVLISYLLLNAINPRLIQFQVPSLRYIPQILVADQYCEAQGPKAIAAAQQAGAECGDYVDYEDNGVRRTCISLYIPGQIALPWDQQLACFPRVGIDKVTDPSGKTSTSTHTVYERRKAAGKDGVCENNNYTADDRCVYTQRILGLQTWLAGACKKAKYETKITAPSQGKDICHYTKFLFCPTSDSEQVRCDAGVRTRETDCWSGGKPREMTSAPTAFSGLTAVCRDPNVGTRPIELIDGICCQANLKRDIFCTSREVEDTVELSTEECAALSADAGTPFAQVCYTERLGDRGTIRRICEDVVTRCDLPKKCKARIDFIFVNTDPPGSPLFK